ncbi:sporulation related protein [Tamilnaduibacter salinus]|uniref:Sporulation related protein n=1 Tax=Tamilnaduibacter salinus TaxID=1484056 RepID=A0A2U1CU50_9GAMM|nr:SPOR domain-containing protein [Tamilnaduibacter salinus]PVY70369.1 sporulation related protein [Tamilnaduibacter salinus]
MTKDYASRSQRGKPRGAAPTKPAGKPRTRPAPKRATARPSRQGGSLSLRWILSLALVGGFVGFIVYLNTLPVDPSPSQPAESDASDGSVGTGAADTENAQETSTTSDQPKKQSFEFYEMLPESEVVPPEVEAYQPGPSEAKDHFQYVVQAGSFKGEKDAERQRAEIAFQGLRAHVKKVTLDSGTVWYRVSVGPFESRSKMNSALDRLVSIDIQPLVRKVPNKSDSG